MVSRRDFLKVAGMGAGAALLNACAPQSTPPPSDTQALDAPAPFVTPVSTRTPRIITPTLSPGPTATVQLMPTPGWAPSSRYAALNLCFVLWDHQLARYNYKPRNIYNPMPETCPLYSGDMCLITPAWEAYWKGLLRVCNPGMSAGQFQHSWSSLVQSDRAFTNGTGPETGFFATHSLTCGGATHAMATGIPETLPEGAYMRIYTLKWSNGPPPIPGDPDEIDMTRHFFATAGSNRQLPDGSYAVNGFPQFENCIVPLITQSETDLIAVSRIKRVMELQRPYNP